MFPKTLSTRLPPPSGGVSHLNPKRTASKKGILEDRGRDTGLASRYPTFKTPEGATQIRTRDLQLPG
ncbi:hypothetical protein TorRG33x02_038610 [Trema orientale]|uniref:Uncharacterized protein n=1 Tax=Trema orientale TaxID=63057 RepID=A0A2P5FRK3_TREOI|nr:hypothetical protein TorRG33x02_038610 [Trema orientale]